MHAVVTQKKKKKEKQNGFLPLCTAAFGGLRCFRASLEASGSHPSLLVEGFNALALHKKFRGFIGKKVRSHLHMHKSKVKKKKKNIFCCDCGLQLPDFCSSM